MLVALLLAALAWRPAGVAAGGGSCVELQRSEPRYNQDNWANYQAQLRDEVANVDTGPVCTFAASLAALGVSADWGTGRGFHISGIIWHVLQGSICKRRSVLTSSTTISPETREVLQGYHTLLACAVLMLADTVFKR